MKEDPPPQQGGGGAGGGNGVTTNTQITEPWSGVQPYLKELFNLSQNKWQQGTYPGEYLTPQSPWSKDAIHRQAVRGYNGSPLLGAAQSQNIHTLQGGYLSPESNPYLSGAVQTALDQVKRNVSGQFSGENYGTSANQGWLAKNMAETALPIYAQNYQTERGRQQQATQMAPGLAQADYFDIGQLANAGAATEGRGQAEIQAAQQKWQAPWENIANYQRGITGQFGSTTTQNNPYFTNPLASALGMGIGGLSMFNGLNKSGMFNNLFKGGGDPWNSGQYGNFEGSFDGGGTYQPDFSGGYY